MKTITPADYKRELSALVELIGVDDKAYEIQRRKFDAMVAIMMAQPSTNQFITTEILVGLDEFNDCGVPLDNPDVQTDLWLLEMGGHKKEADEIRALSWS